MGNWQEVFPNIGRASLGKECWCDIVQKRKRERKREGDGRGEGGMEGGRERTGNRSVCSHSRKFRRNKGMKADRKGEPFYLLPALFRLGKSHQRRLWSARFFTRRQSRRAHESEQNNPLSFRIYNHDNYSFGLIHSDYVNFVTVTIDKTEESEKSYRE